MAKMREANTGIARGKGRIHIKSIELVDNYRKHNYILYYLFEKRFTIIEFRT